MNDIEAEIQELLNKIIARVKMLPEGDQKQILTELAQIEQSLRASGGLDTSSTSRKTDDSVNAVAAQFNPGVNATLQLQKFLRKGGKLEDVPMSILAFLPFETIAILERRAKMNAIDAVKDRVAKRHARERGVPEELLDFANEQDVTAYEDFKAEQDLKNLDPNAISKSLRKLTEEPFYVRKRGGKAFGRGLPIGTKQERIPILNLKGQVIGYEDAEGESHE